jgi:alginate O-acetyltransferase complex protein AlgI
MNPDYFIWGSWLIIQCLAGYFYVLGNGDRRAVWTFPIFSVLFSHLLFLDGGGLWRMLALIIPLLHAMKVVVAAWHPKGKLPLGRYLVYYWLTVSMDPSIFTQRKMGITLDWRLALNGVGHILLGTLILALLRFYAPAEKLGVALYLWSLPALFALSAILHFGLLPLSTVFLQWLGFPARRAFRLPFLSLSLSEFWGKRWNVPFSEMTATAAFKPWSRVVGVKWAGLLAFLLSGLLHEIAISFSVQEGYGLPMLYFLIHGLLMAAEKKWFGRKKPGKVWVVTALVLPLPLLFHANFLREVVWEIVRLSP